MDKSIGHLAKCGFRFLKDKNYRFLILSGTKICEHLSDREFLERLHLSVMGVRPDFDNPKLFSEKLNWLKLYDRKPIYTVMADKHLAKSFVAEKLGEEYVVPTLGVWDSPYDIDFDALPQKFVLKCNHTSGSGMFICKNKSKLGEKQIKKIRKDISAALKQDYFQLSREWPYKDIPRKIIAEKYMEDEQQNEDIGLYDYKFFCFNGEPKFLYVASGGHTKAHLAFVSVEWERMPFKRYDYGPFDELPPRPSKFDEMLKIAAQFSQGIPFIRVDLYEIGGQVYFSEFTFSNCGGFMHVDPPEWNRKLGDMLDLPEKQ